MLKAFHPSGQRDLLGSTSISKAEATTEEPSSGLRLWKQKRSTDGSALQRDPAAWVSDLIDSRGREDGASSLKLVNSLTLRLMSATGAWIDAFIVKGGIDEILELLVDWRGSPENSNIALKALLVAARHRVAIDAIASAADGIQAITFAFGRFSETTAEVMDTRKNVLELLTVLTSVSHSAHALALAAWEDFRNQFGERIRFETLVGVIADPVDSVLQWQLKSMVAVLVNEIANAPELELRVAIRADLQVSRRAQARLLFPPNQSSRLRRRLAFQRRSELCSRGLSWRWDSSLLRGVQQRGYRSVTYCNRSAQT
jgi:hypothetical protein